MATYDCIQDYGQQPGAQYISQSAGWIMAVFRFLYPNTYSRATGRSFQTISGGIPEAVRQRVGGPVVLTSSVLSMDIGSQKAEHTMSLNATLAPDGYFESTIYPGDWVMAWMFTNDVDYGRVLKNLSAYQSGGGTQALNGFNDGLKFVGRVQSIRKNLTQNPAGPRTVRYSLAAVGFGELDATCFFEPALADSNNTPLGLIWGRLNIKIEKLIANPSGKGGGALGISPQLAVPKLLSLLLGTGLPNNFMRSDPSQPGQAQGVTGLATGGSAGDAQYAYRIPTVVAQALGKDVTVQTDGVGYTDLLESCVGIQLYNSTGSNSGNYGPQPVNAAGNNAQNYGLAFMPSNVSLGGDSTFSRRLTGLPLNGIILPQSLQFSGNPVWTILSQFLNPGMNEQYICLRANPDGYVVPTYVARQFPFSTDDYKGSVWSRPNLDKNTQDSLQKKNAGNLTYAAPEGGPLPFTRFLSLPTWGVDPVMVVAANIGRSDALRFNFVHVYGNSERPQDDTQQIIYSPPVRDDLDISRSGLRPFMTTVPCSYKAVAGGDAAKWMSLLSDFMMGQQLTLTGSLTSAGIQAPICIGDNLEWEENTYHIEGVNHHVEISPDGRKAFTTTISLTHGIRTKPIPETANEPDFGIYGDTIPNGVYDPGFTVDEPVQDSASQDSADNQVPASTPQNTGTP